MKKGNKNGLRFSNIITVHIGYSFEYNCIFSLVQQ